jgi:ferredoxin
MKLLKTPLLFCAALLLFNSCTKQNSSISNSTWEQAEQKFGMNHHFSDASKKAILNKYKTIDAFIDFVNQRKAVIASSKKEIRTTPAIYAAQAIIANGDTVNFDIADDQFVLETMMNNGFDIHSCDMSGSSSTCVALLHTGTIDQSLQSFLDDDQIAAGYFLPCVTYPTSNLVFEAEQEDNML